MRVAVLGANGFIGHRLVERLHLGRRAEMVPIVRRPSSAALLARFALPCRVADGMDEAALTQALQGCDAVVHAAAGDQTFVEQSPQVLVRAAARARVQRIVYLSSLAVHG